MRHLVAENLFEKRPGPLRNGLGDPNFAERWQASPE
jgi:hypothetical protein